MAAKAAKLPQKKRTPQGSVRISLYFVGASPAAKAPAQSKMKKGSPAAAFFMVDGKELESLTFRTSSGSSTS